MFCGFGGYGPLNSFGIGGMFLMMGFKMLVFVGLIILAVKLVKNYTNRSSDPMRILNEKFAGGEMSQEEYLQRKAILAQKQ